MVTLRRRRFTSKPLPRYTHARMPSAHASIASMRIDSARSLSAFHAKLLKQCKQFREEPFAITSAVIQCRHYFPFVVVIYVSVWGFEAI